MMNHKARIDVQAGEHPRTRWFWPSMALGVLLACHAALIEAAPPAADRAKIERCGRLWLEAMKLKDQGRAQEAIRKALASLELHREIEGADSPASANGILRVVALLDAFGEYKQAVPLCREALRVGLKNADKNDPSKGHELLANAVNMLANQFVHLNDLSQAEPLYRQALALRTEAFGERHPSCGQSLLNLATLYEKQGDLRLSLKLYQKAIDLFTRPENRYLRAMCLNGLANLHEKALRPAMAEPLAREAIELFEQSVGKSHWAYAAALNTLGNVYSGLGDYPRSWEHYQQALAIFQRLAHPHYATCRANQAELLMRMKKYREAEAIYQETLRMVKQSLGTRHPSYARRLSGLAQALLAQDRAAEARPLAEEALRITLQSEDYLAQAQSQRQQALTAQFDIGYLATYLSAAVASREAAEPMFTMVSAWKGAVAAAYRHARRRRQAARAKPNSEIGRLTRDLDVSIRDFCNRLARQPPEDEIDDIRQATGRAQAEIEELERRLTKLDGKSRPASRQEGVALERLRESLPSSTALIDFFEYAQYQPPTLEPPPPGSRHRTLAFVITRDRPLACVDLGASNTFQERIQSWRDGVGQASSAERRAAAAQLRVALWEPLAKHLGGAETILISPTGSLGELPWGALPGATDDVYLIEERAFAVIVAPELLPEIVAAEAPAAPDSLLLVNDIHYGGAAPTGALAQRSGRTRDTAFWRALNGTTAEGTGVNAAFQGASTRGGSRVLQGAAATEDAFRRLAPTCRYLHVATHGFFALRQVEFGNPESDTPRQSVGLFHPAVLSGIVFAGANEPWQPNRDDGILTAWEVSTLDLSDVELATLSACETGLGSTIGFEGLRGLQQAFQVAGAHTTVASLWRIPDGATSALMQRFYENLWNKKMGKLAALREAQLWMLREVPKDAKLRAAATRGLNLPDVAPEISTTEMPPYFWAAFVLSGDWR